MLLRLDENVEIDMSYITCAEYQLFIDEKFGAGETRQPDHWKETKFLRGHATQPITGVRVSDAIEFCQWLTQQHSSPDFRYRLPTLEEVIRYPITHEYKSKLGCWCTNGQEYLIAGVDHTQLEVWQIQLANDLILRPDRSVYGNIFRFFERDRYIITDKIYSKFFNFFDSKSNPELYRDLDRILNRGNNKQKITLYSDNNLLTFLQKVQERNLHRELERRRILESNILPTLNNFFENYIEFNRSELLNLNLYSQLLFKIESRQARDFQILYYPLMVMIAVCHQLEFIYNKATQDRSLLSHNINSQKCLEISNRYAEKIHEIFKYYSYLVLLDERQSGRIPAWESIRIVRQRIY
jgi:hypothetical protein